MNFTLALTTRWKDGVSSNIPTLASQDAQPERRYNAILFFSLTLDLINILEMNHGRKDLDARLC